MGSVSSAPRRQLVWAQSS
ncbi:hypothetical protein HaLaN_10740, partial [Haematococcus lacustris]